MIDTIFFDVGNTLRIVLPEQDFIDKAEKDLMDLIQTKESHDELFAKLEERWKKYRKQAKSTLIDASEMELWSQYLLPDYDPELICANAGRLTRLWRDHDGRRVPRPDVKSTLIELDKRGYTMGIIANTVTETEIPDWMIEDKVAHYFKSVILSSKVRIRKPDPAIYYLACRAIGKKPENCAYVGDNPIRDVQGTRDAGFAMMIRIDEPDTIKKEPQEITLHPDYTINNISDLLDIFKPLK
ncbi:MAG: HAD family hydrolase [Spirochaetales bacterium]|jgi:HAD superfamily hydrolase (TIGR01509 family)|nr:HAD family hydrolase [Spirochaetales bacterium]